MVTLLEQAAKAQEELAAALDTAANAYYVDDIEGMRRLQGIQSWFA